MVVEPVATLAPVVPLRTRARGRPVIVLHPSLAARYTALVADVAPSIDPALGPCVFANRLAAASVDPPELLLRPWRHERAAFARRLTALAASSPCLVFADVRDCYGSIASHVVERSLARLGASSRRSVDVARFLRRLGDLGVRGLPVGPDASAVLANAVLSAVDRAVSETGLGYARWVDDVAIACEGQEHAAHVLGLVGEALAEVGLEPNEEKTRVVLDPSSVTKAPTISCARARARVG